MKYNKGFAPLVIIAIVLGFLAVGSGAYLLGKNQNEKVNIVNEEQEENKLVSDCLLDSDPWVKVISPNGGETFIIGQEIEVKWKTCNIDNARVFIEIYNKETTGLTLVDDIDNGIDNDGSETIILSNSKYAGLVSGDYELRVYANNLRDFSDGTFTINSDSEESISEIFTNQPGAIKSVKSYGLNKWILEVDLLSSNHDWVPGVNSPFINQNTKIRDLTVNFDTKIYECNEGAKPTILVNNSNFINDTQNKINQRKEDFKHRVGGKENMTDWVIVNFDINGTNITTVHERCLP